MLVQNYACLGYGWGRRCKYLKSKQHAKRQNQQVTEEEDAVSQNRGKFGQIRGKFGFDSVMSVTPSTSHGTEKTEKQCQWIHLSRKQWKSTKPPACSAPSLLSTRPQTCSAQPHSCWIPSSLEDSSLLMATAARWAKYEEVFHLLLTDVTPSLSSVTCCSEPYLVCLPEAPAALLIHK